MREDPFSLTGARVLVTGASSGLGRAIAIACARRGAIVVASGRDPARL
ncbi:MAG: SDR family NAD(P)-dependent oxidoreductase, partial [Burkholderiales bacterium]|nr:SDR family NAD(P)-dependent oxidoreductase [Burkholderiales bacterium]